MNATRQRRFEVYIGSRKITEVYADADLRAVDVRRSLIGHDGMPQGDVARASHPEELR